MEEGTSEYPEPTRKRQLYTLQMRGAWTQTLTVRTHCSLQSKASWASIQTRSLQNSRAIRCPGTISSLSQLSLVLSYLVARSGKLQHPSVNEGSYAASLKCDQPSPVLQGVLMGLGIGTTTPISQMGKSVAFSLRTQTLCT